jgi:hypothetical protein
MARTFLVLSGGRYLLLAGPFAYPEWSCYPSAATRLSLPKASQWVEAVGGEVVDADRLLGSAVDPRFTEGPPSTERSGSKARADIDAIWDELSVMSLEPME